MNLELLTRHNGNDQWVNLEEPNEGWTQYAERLFQDDTHKLYDNANTGTSNNEVAPPDVAITAVLNSCVRYNAIKNVWDKRQDISQQLSQIPNNTDLANANDALYEDVSKIFSTLCSLQYIKLSTASKVLHRKRPLLIPIMDERVREHYKTFFQNNSSEQEKGIEIMKVMSKEIACPQNEEFFCSLRTKWNLSRVRLLEKVIWERHKQPNTCNICRHYQ